MTTNGDKERRRGAVALSELVGRVLDPVTARRGFATADLIAAWPEVVGQRYADCTAPEKIQWPRGAMTKESAGVLVLKVDGPKAILVQHELGQIMERINGFLGYAAIGQIRLIQAPVGKATKPPGGTVVLGADAQAKLDASIAAVEDEVLRAALARLGHGVLADSLKKR